MGRINLIQNSFLGGEFSPRSIGRTDLPRYPHGAQEIKNMIVKNHGGAYRRNGTKFVNNTSSDLKTRLIPFVPNDEETYVIEITGVQGAATNSVVTATNTETEVQTNISLLNAGWLEADLDTIQYAQLGDLLILVNVNRKPLMIRRTATDTFFAIEWDEQVTGGTANPLYPGNNQSTYGFFENPENNITMTPSATSGAITLTTSAAFFVSPTGSGFLADNGHEFSYFQINGGFVRVDSVTSSTTANATVVATLSGTGATADFFESWSDAAGWPRAIQFFQNRLMFGGSVTKPDTVWFSEADGQGNLNFRADVLGSGVVATSPGAFTVASAKSNQIQWLSGSKNLNIGTLGDEYIAFDISGTTVPDVRRETSIGSAYSQPVQLSSEIMFVNRSRRSLHEFQFNLDADTYRSVNMSLLAEHLFDEFANDNSLTTTGIKNIAFQESPSQVVWCVTDDGALFALSRLQDQGIVAWHKHELGGESASGVPPIVEDVIAIPTKDATHEQIWMVVRREINSSTVRYLEYIGPDFRGRSLTSESDTEIFCDSAILVDLVTPGTTVTGLSHLEGEVVQIMGDGKFQGTKTVSGGQITLDASATKVLVGLQYASRIKTLPMERGSATGSAQGLTRRVDRVTIRVFDTIGMEFSNNDSDFEEVEFRDFTAPIGDPIDPFTGIKVLEIQNMEVPNGGVEDGVITFRQEKPLPMNIASVTMRAHTYES